MARYARLFVTEWSLRETCSIHAQVPIEDLVLLSVDDMVPSWPSLLDAAADGGRILNARWKLVDALMHHFPTRLTAVKAVLNNQINLLHIYRADDGIQRLRDIIPSLFLRLGHDQDAYDFVKWWATCRPADDYVNDVTLPYLDINNADPFDKPTNWTGHDLDLGHAAAVMLIKIRLLADLRAAQNAARGLDKLDGRGHFPQETVTHICRYLVASSIVAAQWVFVADNINILASKIDLLHRQVRSLFAATHHANKHFWSTLEDPGDALTINQYLRPLYSKGSVYQAKLMVRYSHGAWRGTPGAMVPVRRLLLGLGLLS